MARMVRSITTISDMRLVNFGMYMRQQIIRFSLAVLHSKHDIMIHAHAHIATLQKIGMLSRH